MSGRPDAPGVPGGTDARESGPDGEAARAVPGTRTGVAGTGPAGTGPAGITAAAGAPAPGSEAGMDEAAPPADAGRDGTAPGTAGEAPGTATGTEAAAAARARAMAARLAAGWPLRRTFAVGVLITTLFSVLAITIGGTALANLASARDRVVNKIDPAAFRTSQLEVAFLNQETGVRGYALSAQLSFLRPYTQGVRQQNQHVGRLRVLLAGMPAAQADLTRVIGRAETWRASYAEPTITRVRATGKPQFTAVPAD